MKTKVELDLQVADFVRALAPEPRKRLREALRSAIREIQSTPRRLFNAEEAEVGAEERGGGLSLRPWR